MLLSRINFQSGFHSRVAVLWLVDAVKRHFYVRIKSVRAWGIAASHKELRKGVRGSYHGFHAIHKIDEDSG